MIQFFAIFSHRDKLCSAKANAKVTRNDTADKNDDCMLINSSFNIFEMAPKIPIDNISGQCNKHIVESIGMNYRDDLIEQRLISGHCL